MNVIKTVGPAKATREEAEDVVAGMLAIPGVMFSYVDSENRAVIFLIDFHPEVSLMNGQERLTLKFPEAKEPPKETDFFKNLGDAMMGKGPWARQ